MLITNDTEPVVAKSLPPIKTAGDSAASMLDGSKLKAIGIWKRTVAAIKDKKSLAGAYFSARSSHRNLDFEAAIIKATSHDEYDIGERNEQIVFQWIRASPENIYPLVRGFV
ncbi:hypothetical protein V6N12_005987 [Hibiscus sabdariffa]|uniref:Uncharacterized protein n=1 Tax=Hibiscus sabdariffa TaxID=183260 RepID=A0ABR2EWP0_9ROSI